MLQSFSCEIIQALKQYVTDEAKQICSVQQVSAFASPETVVDSFFDTAVGYAPTFLTLIALGKELKIGAILTSLAHEQPTEDDMENFFYNSQP